MAFCFRAYTPCSRVIVNMLSLSSQAGEVALSEVRGEKHEEDQGHGGNSSKQTHEAGSARPEGLSCGSLRELGLSF